MYRTDLIRVAMAKKDWTQEQLADESGLSRPTVSAIVNGKSGVLLESLSAIARALEIPLSELFTEPEEAAA
jgi:transcriptional regulator with XRE-family HTH domain